MSEFGTRDGIQVAFAEIGTAYEDVRLQRLVALMPGNNGRDYVVDIMRGLGVGEHRFDLPVHFKGQLIETSFEMQHAVDRLEPFGDTNGYQHLWKRSESEPLDGLQEISWLLGDQFYTLTQKSDQAVTAYFTELGANDPNHNMRHEQALILRASGTSANFVSVYERHGRYDSDEEITVFDGSSIADISIDTQNGITSIKISPVEGDATTFRLAESGLTRQPLQILRHQDSQQQDDPGEETR